MLTTEQVEQFISLYKKRFGKEISKEEAYDKGTKLIKLVELVYKPMTEKEYQKYKVRNK